MADNRANLLYSESTSLSALLSNIVNSRNIINVGIITKVIDENFINVRLYNTDIRSNPTYISAVRLLHIGTSKLKIKVAPAIGDTVLLLASRDFIEVLENNHDKKAAEIMVEPYSKSTMQAILISPEEDDNNKTAITINEDGNITLETLGKIDVSIKEGFEDSDESKTVIGLNKDGKISLETVGNINVSVKDSLSNSGNKLVDFVMDTENNFTLTTYDSGSAINTIKMSSDGVTTTTDKDINLSANGNITLETLGKIDVSIKDNFSDTGKKLVDFVMDTAKTFTLTTYDNGSAKNTIKMESDGVTINNNLSIANT